MAGPLPLCYLNGAYLPLAEARISPLDRGFLYSDGVYELMPVYGGRPFRFAAHGERLTRAIRIRARTGAPSSARSLKRMPAATVTSTGR
jgi:hypothetical protein